MEEISQWPIAQMTTDNPAQEYMNVVNILNGATWLFQLAGLGAITSLGHLQTCVTWRKWNIWVCFGHTVLKLILEVIRRSFAVYIFSIVESSCEVFFFSQRADAKFNFSPHTHNISYILYITTSSTSTLSTSHTSSPASLCMCFTIHLWFIPFALHTSHTSSTHIYINFIYRCSASTYLLNNIHVICTRVLTQELWYTSRCTGPLIQEFLLRSRYTGVVARSCSTGVLTQDVLHGSSYTGVDF